MTDGIVRRYYSKGIGKRRTKGHMNTTMDRERHRERMEIAEMPPYEVLKRLREEKGIEYNCEDGCKEACREQELARYAVIRGYRKGEHYEECYTDCLNDCIADEALPRAETAKEEPSFKEEEVLF